MQRIENVNYDRVRLFCQERGLTIDDVGRELGISQSSIDRLKKGEPAFTFNQLKKLANYFGRTILFFLEAEPLELNSVYSAQYRTIANRKPNLSTRVKALIERTEVQRDLFIALHEELRQEKMRFTIPKALTQKQNFTAHVRKWLGLANQNDFNSYRAAFERVGILVFRSNGYAGKWQIPKDDPILGFSIYDARCPLIFIKKQAAEVRQTFTLAHELGHLLLHQSSFADYESDLDSKKQAEIQANAFAGKFLVPDKFLEEIDDQTRPKAADALEEWLSRQRRKWGVSTEVILRRLLDSGRLTRSIYAEYRNWKSGQPEVRVEGRGSRIYRHREPKHIFGDKFVSTVLDSLSSRQITLTKASQYLDSLKIQDVHKLESHYASF